MTPSEQSDIRPVGSVVDAYILTARLALGALPTNALRELMRFDPNNTVERLARGIILKEIERRF